MAESDDAERRLFRAAVLAAMRETVEGEPDPAYALQVLESQLAELLEGPPLDPANLVEEIRFRATLAVDLRDGLNALRAPVGRT